MTRADLLRIAAIVAIFLTVGAVAGREDCCADGVGVTR